MEKKSPPGFERSYIYTGEEKGGLDPEEEVGLLRRPLPLNLILLISPIPPPRFNESLDILNIPIILTMPAPKQHKQRYYYIFWSIATLAVVCGQIYVASSYKDLAEALRLSLL